MTPPILFIVFNRPATTARVFEAIREARPARLYVAADGPRPNRPGDIDLCQEVRDIATNADWPCELKTLFRDENLGCRLAVSTAISWFFNHEDEGIILEDDCLPQSCFFSYCEALLERYRHDEKVMVIAGDRGFAPPAKNLGTYEVSRLPQIWGWASWRRAWQYYSFEEFMKADWADVLRNVTECSAFIQNRVETYNRIASFDLCTWDAIWAFCVFQREGLTLFPPVNLITNIGHGAGATHTDCIPSCRQMPVGQLKLPMEHPRSLVFSFDLESFILMNVYGIKAVACDGPDGHRSAFVHIAKKSKAAVTKALGFFWQTLGEVDIEISRFAKSRYGVRLKRIVGDETNRYSICGLYGDRIAGHIETMGLGEVFIDVGANAGLWSLLAAKKVGQCGLVLAFEPRADLRQVLDDNCLMNRIDNVYVFPLALGSHPGRVAMAHEQGHSGKSHIVVDSGARERSTLVLNADFLKSILMELDKPCVIKIDVEGWEMSVLQGMSNVLKNKNVYLVIIEINADHLRRSSSRFGEIYNFMTAHGFRALYGDGKSYRVQYDEVFVRDGA